MTYLRSIELLTPLLPAFVAGCIAGGDVGDTTSDNGATPFAASCSLGDTEHSRVELNGREITVALRCPGTRTRTKVETGLANGLVNADFSDGLSGWEVELLGGGTNPGQVFVESEQGVLLERGSFLTTLLQSFTVPANASMLAFDVFFDPGFDLRADFIPDAFEVSLLDDSYNSVVPTWHSLATSFFNVQEDLSQNFGPGVMVVALQGKTNVATQPRSHLATKPRRDGEAPDLALRRTQGPSSGVLKEAPDLASGVLIGGAAAFHVTLDVSGVPAGTPVTLFIDLIGADTDIESGVRVDGFAIGSSNQPPDCDAGGPYSAACQGMVSTVGLDGTGSTDPDEDEVTYAWTTDCPGGSFDDASGPTPVLSLTTDPGCSVTCTVTLTVDDGTAEPVSCTAGVSVTDTSSPAIDCPSDTTVTCGESTDPSATGEASATDACDSDPAIAYADTETSAQCPADAVQKTITRTWTATDVCSNGISCDQDITVLKQPRTLIIKQGACPAPFNRSSHGVLPVLLTGEADFDVTRIDLSTVRLSRADCVGGTVAPLQGPPGPTYDFRDLNNPYEGDGPCSCNPNERSDRITDLALKFRSDDVTTALELGPLPQGEVVELALTGRLDDGCEFVARDCVLLASPALRTNARLTISAGSATNWIDASPLDELWDGGGFGIFERTHPIGTQVTLTAPSRLPSGARFAAWTVNGVLQPAGQRAVNVTVTGGSASAKAQYAGVIAEPAIGE